MQGTERSIITIPGYFTNHAHGAGSIARRVDQQSNALSLHHGRPFNCMYIILALMHFFICITNREDFFILMKFNSLCINVEMSKTFIVRMFMGLANL